MRSGSGMRDPVAGVTRVSPQPVVQPDTGMAIKVRCQQCGKLAQFADSDVGLVALCLACGARLSVPATNTPDPAATTDDARSPTAPPNPAAEVASTAPDPAGAI